MGRRVTCGICHMLVVQEADVKNQTFYVACSYTVHLRCVMGFVEKYTATGDGVGIRCTAYIFSNTPFEFLTAA